MSGVKNMIVHLNHGKKLDHKSACYEDHGLHHQPFTATSDNDSLSTTTSQVLLHPVLWLLLASNLARRSMVVLRERRRLGMLSTVSKLYSENVVHHRKARLICGMNFNLRHIRVIERFISIKMLLSLLRKMAIWILFWRMLDPIYQQEAIDGLLPKKGLY
ncbi:unnamed protein product [Lactuca virosa]|uniref:Uncharacterized protein n=1 Tax=Lactuca virosa TaxID=75947 RepID=A0AAU9P968_9ASTR|nr:unnamed protein product [Lactuca virosa]